MENSVRPSWNKDPILIWKPVVEPNIPGMERFLPAQPVELIRRGKFHKVPAIFGITRDEFGGVVVGRSSDFLI